MPKTIKEFQLNQSTGEVSVEYSDDSTSKFNAADMVTAQTDPVTGGVEFVLPNGASITADVNVSSYGDGVSQYAFDAAKIAAGVGGCVYVGPGNYVLDNFDIDVPGQTWVFNRAAKVTSLNAALHPSIVVSANDVNILGGGTFDNAALSSDPYADVGCIKITGSRVSVEGMVLTGSRGPCLDIKGASSIRVKGNRFYNTWYAAVFVRPIAADIEDILICDNSIINSVPSTSYKYGINVHNDISSEYGISGVRIHGNKVSFPEVSSGDYPLGIELYGGPHGSTGTIRNASVTGNCVDGSSIAISLSQCSNSAVTGNSVKNAYLTGIEIVNPDCVTISGNAIDGGQQNKTLSGVLISEVSASSSVSGNTVSNTRDHGIYASNANANVVVCGNMINTSLGYGITLLNVKNWAVSSNVLDGNGSATKAIMLDKSDHGTITGNSVTGWSQNGVLLYADSAAVYDRITVVGNVFIGTVNSLSLHTQMSNGAMIGNFLSYVNNTSDVDGSNHRDYFNVNTSRVRFSGTGSPEGVYSAGVGSEFIRTDGGAGTTLYIKESGSGSTGWVGK